MGLVSKIQQKISGLLMSTLNKISLNVAIMLPLIMKPKEMILQKEL